MKRRVSRITRLRSKNSSLAKLGAFFEPLDVDIESFNNPFSKTYNNPSSKVNRRKKRNHIPDLVVLPPKDITKISETKIPIDGKNSFPTGIVKSSIKTPEFNDNTTYHQRKRRTKSSRQLGITREQLDILKQANNRLRELEKNAFARASPAANAVINRLSVIYGDNKPDEVEFNVDNLSSAKKAQVIAEARKFLKMSSSTVEGTQVAINNRDIALAERWDLIRKDSFGNYIMDEKGNYVIDNERFTSYRDIAELYSSDISTYNLGSAIAYDVISTSITDGVDYDVIKITLEIAIKAVSEKYMLDVAEVSTRLGSEIDVIEKAMEYLTMNNVIEWESETNFIEKYYKGSISEMIYGNDMDKFIEDIEYYSTHLNDRREEVDIKKTGNFKFKW